MVCMTEIKNLSDVDLESSETHLIRHFGFRISDEKKWEEIVRVNDLKILFEGAIKYPFSKSWYLKDPDGHIIEVSYSDTRPLKFPSMPK